MASNLTEKVATGVEELRDRAAETIAGDGESVFRALKRLAERIDEAEMNLQESIIDAETTIADGLDDVASEQRRTTWPRRLFWLLLGAGAVASVFVSNPDKAKELRNKIQR